MPISCLRLLKSWAMSLKRFISSLLRLYKDRADLEVKNPHLYPACKPFWRYRVQNCKGQFFEYGMLWLAQKGKNKYTPISLLKAMSQLRPMSSRIFISSYPNVKNAEEKVRYIFIQKILRKFQISFFTKRIDVKYASNRTVALDYFFSFWLLCWFLLFVFLHRIDLYKKNNVKCFSRKRIYFGTLFMKIYSS